VEKARVDDAGISNCQDCRSSRALDGCRIGLDQDKVAVPAKALALAAVVNANGLGIERRAGGNMSGGRRPRAGRKPIEIDLEQLEKLCNLDCTHEEIANWFGVSVRTIESRCKQRAFAKVMERGRAKGRISLRRRK